MKISILNGSPKQKKSTSELLVNYALSQLGNNNDVKIYNIGKDILSENQYKVIAESEAILFVFPLYIDSIPSDLLRLLIRFEEKKLFHKNIMIYCIINNGFYEGQQNSIAIEQMKNWCMSAGSTWGQAIGIGAGEMLPFIADVPLGYGPNKNLGNAINQLAFNLLNRKKGADILVSPNWPRILWKIQSSLIFWFPRAKQNNLKIRDIAKKSKIK